MREGAAVREKRGGGGQGGERGTDETETDRDRQEGRVLGRCQDDKKTFFF